MAAHKVRIYLNIAPLILQLGRVSWFALIKSDQLMISGFESSIKPTLGRQPISTDLLHEVHRIPWQPLAHQGPGREQLSRAPSLLSHQRVETVHQSKDVELEHGKKRFFICRQSPGVLPFPWQRRKTVSIVSDIIANGTCAEI